MTARALHPLVEAAAEGRLPDWAAVRPARRRHIEGVLALMDRWAGDLNLDGLQRKRWRAAAMLHDSLRDADPETLVEAEDLPPRLRHGPAAAARLRGAGVEDAELLEAVRYHTLGWSGWGHLGRFLYLADYLEPGRAWQPAHNASLRARLPADHEQVLRAVCAGRLSERIRRGGALRSESVDFWNSLRGKK